MNNLESLGLLFKPDGTKSWSLTHMMMPTPEKLSDSVYRIYYGTRNQNNQSSIGAIDVDFSSDQPREVQRLDYPLLTPGKLGTFDDNGVLPSCCVTLNGVKYMYYVGFKPGGTTRMDLFGGLSAWNPEKHLFERVSEAPLLERNRINPFINTAPWILEISGTLVMYYVAGLGWLNSNTPRYEIQIATSVDGVSWEREGRTAIGLEPGENAAARPSVFFRNGNYEMWFSTKGENYSPKVAISKDGFSWMRASEPSLDTSSKAQDDVMQEYFVPVFSGPDFFLAYNGNDYGRFGINILREKKLSK